MEGMLSKRRALQLESTIKRGSVSSSGTVKALPFGLLLRFFLAKRFVPFSFFAATFASFLKLSMHLIKRLRGTLFGMLQVYATRSEFNWV